MSTTLLEPLPQMFSRSRLMVLDFAQIPAGTPADESIEEFFKQHEANGLDPRLPENRQKFNDRLLDKTSARYLVSRYGEDRVAMLAGSSIQKAGRTLHLGIDIFSKDCEPVYAPCDGEIVRLAQEPENHSFGYYLILKPADSSLPYLFFGHLGAERHALGPVKAGEQIARLGDFAHHENGGWSRHLHLQMLSALPPEGEHPVGYASTSGFEEAKRKYPDPTDFFPAWKI